MSNNVKSTLYFRLFASIRVLGRRRRTRGVVVGLGALSSERRGWGVGGGCVGIGDLTSSIRGLKTTPLIYRNNKSVPSSWLKVVHPGSA